MTGSLVQNPFDVPVSPGVGPGCFQGSAFLRCSENKAICHGVFHHEGYVREDPIKIT